MHGYDNEDAFYAAFGEYVEHLQSGGRPDNGTPISQYMGSQYQRFLNWCEDGGHTPDPYVTFVEKSYRMIN
jgi:hypothetical protein